MMKHHSKKYLKYKCSEILNKYQLAKQVTDFEDIEFLYDIFSRHPEFDLKQGCGIGGIYVWKNTYGGRCFWLKRIDGTKTDISFIKCIDGKPSKIYDITIACRNAIEPEIIRFKKENVKFGETKCAITGEILFMGNIHIDHYDLNFKDVLKEWLIDKDIDYLYSKINPPKDGECKTYFVDNGIIEDFISFHNKHTHLRAVTIHANLSRNRN